MGMNVTEGNMTGPGFYMEEFAFENVTQPNMTEFMEVPALEDVKFEASCAALRFDGSVKGETKVSDATKIEELLCFTSTLTLPCTTMCRFVQSQRGMP